VRTGTLVKCGLAAAAVGIGIYERQRHYRWEKEYLAWGRGLSKVLDAKANPTPEAMAMLNSIAGEHGSATADRIYKGGFGLYKMGGTKERLPSFWMDREHTVFINYWGYAAVMEYYTRSIKGVKSKKERDAFYQKAWNEKIRQHYLRPLLDEEIAVLVGRLQEYSDEIDLMKAETAGALQEAFNTASFFDEDRFDDSVYARAIDRLQARSVAAAAILDELADSMGRYDRGLTNQLRRQSQDLAALHDGLHKSVEDMRESHRKAFADKKAALIEQSNRFSQAKYAELTLKQAETADTLATLATAARDIDRGVLDVWAGTQSGKKDKQGNEIKIKAADGKMYKPGSLPSGMSPAEENRAAAETKNEEMQSYFGSSAEYSCLGQTVQAKNVTTKSGITNIGSSDTTDYKDVAGAAAYSNRKYWDDMLGNGGSLKLWGKEMAGFAIDGKDFGVVAAAASNLMSDSRKLIKEQGQLMGEYRQGLEEEIRNFSGKYSPEVLRAGFNKGVEMMTSLRDYKDELGNAISGVQALRDCLNFDAKQWLEDKAKEAAWDYLKEKGVLELRERAIEKAKEMGFDALRTMGMDKAVEWLQAKYADISMALATEMAESRIPYAAAVKQGLQILSDAAGFVSAVMQDFRNIGKGFQGDYVSCYKGIDGLYEKFLGQGTVLGTILRAIPVVGWVLLAYDILRSLPGFEYVGGAAVGAIFENGKTFVNNVTSFATAFKAGDVGAMLTNAFTAPVEMLVTAFKSLVELTRGTIKMLDACWEYAKNLGRQLFASGLAKLKKGDIGAAIKDVAKKVGNYVVSVVGGFLDSRSSTMTFVNSKLPSRIAVIKVLQNHNANASFDDIPQSMLQSDDGLQFGQEKAMSLAEYKVFIADVMGRGFSEANGLLRGKEFSNTRTVKRLRNDGKEMIDTYEDWFTIQYKARKLA